MLNLIKRNKIIKGISIGVITVIVLYLFLIYTNNSFIGKWRTIYIETAMSTMTHQWLATAFIPQSVIDKTLNEIDTKFEENKVSSSNIYIPSDNDNSVEIISPNNPQDELLNIFPEIDKTTLPENFEYSPTLQIEDIINLGIKTTAEDAVWAIDVPNKILIVEVKGPEYIGKMAIVKDSSQVIIGKTNMTDRGQTVTDICENYNAVLGINASGFVDYAGHGNGSTPIGIEISEGIMYFPKAGGRNQIAGFDYNNNFRIGYDLDVSELRDAVEFYPNIILNGEKNVNGSFGLGLHPRSVIGQSIDGSTLLLIIDGRQVGYSIGATVSDCADILLKYNTYNAMNLDGGSSASMTYNGKMITKTSSPAATGRTVPNAWIVKGVIVEGRENPRF